MDISVTLESEQLVVPWPDGVPLPESGDRVALNHAGRAIEFVVDDRLFTIAPGASRESSIRLIRGHQCAAGWRGSTFLASRT